MSREKQIKETARDICKICRDYVICEKEFKPCVLAEREAEALCKEGYCKQTEGEWKKVYQNKKATVFECSRCCHLSFGTSDYCICGARMKGG